MVNKSFKCLWMLLMPCQLRVLSMKSIFVCMVELLIKSKLLIKFKKLTDMMRYPCQDHIVILFGQIQHQRQVVKWKAKVYLMTVDNVRFISALSWQNNFWKQTDCRQSFVAMKCSNKDTKVLTGWISKLHKP